MNSGKKLIRALWLLPALIAATAYLATAALTGQQVYDQKCAGCHKLGTYDASGSPDLLGDGSKVSGKYTAGRSGHKGITLTSSDITNVSAFLNNPTVTSSLAISTASLPGASVGAAYSQTLTATGGSAPYTWSYNGTLPPGVTVTSGGVVSGTPTTAGSYSFTALVMDSRSATATKALSITVAAPAPAPMSDNDKKLFLTNCVACHTPSGLENRTSAEIQSAIRGNVGGMGTTQLKALSSSSIDGIARSLVPSTPQVISCDTCHSSSSNPAPTGGQALYDADCAGCHKLSSYDPSGSAPDLYQSTRVDSYYTAGRSGHQGFTLSSTDISDLKTFLNNPGTSPAPDPTPTPTPGSGQAKYDSSCAGCHRMGSYDTSGTAPDLYQTTRVDSYYTPGVSGHKSLTLTAQEISDLKTFFGSTTSPAPTPAPTGGQAVYDANCAGCHRLGTYDASGSAPNLLGDGSELSGEYRAGERGHQGITLSASQISDLRAFLDSPTPAPAPDPAPTPTSGKAVYDANCASCHRLGTYDASGSAPNLSGDGSDVGDKYRAGVEGHKDITLTSEQISSLKTFLNSN